jgi:hypothetical protein
MKKQMLKTSFFHRLKNILCIITSRIPFHWKQLGKITTTNKHKLLTKIWHFVVIYQLPVFFFKLKQVSEVAFLSVSAFFQMLK